MFTQPGEVTFSLPQWVSEYTQAINCIEEIVPRMQFVVEASRLNVQYKTGGPFAAAIFEAETGKLISLGVNLVTTQGLSILHAEIVAIALAQKKLNTFDLGAQNLASHELVTSTEPCAMCFGSIPWSGIRRVVTAARDADARSIGFDEGPKLSQWQQALEERDIKVKTDVLRDAAADVLKAYSESQGIIYNSREGEIK